MTMGKKNEFDIIREKLEPMTPKEVVGWYIMQGDRYTLIDTENNEDYKYICQDVCSNTPDELEEYKFYMQIFDYLQKELVRDCINIHSSIHEFAHSIETVLATITNAAFVCANANALLAAEAARYGEGSQEYKKLAASLEEKLKKAVKLYDDKAYIKIEKKKKGYTVNSKKGEELIGRWLERYTHLLKLAKTIIKAYKNCLKYYGLKWGVPPVLQYMEDVAKLDRNRGRRYKKGIIQKYFTKGEWSKEFSLIPPETDFILSSDHTKKCPPIYPSFKEVEFFENLSGRDSNNLFVR